MARKRGMEMMRLFQKDRDAALQKSHRLEEALTNLRYEGKVSLGRNSRQARQVCEFFGKELMDHIQVEEEVLFPFLQTHVPKLESALRLLHAEHEDLRRNVRGFKLRLKQLSRESRDAKRARITDRLQEIGTYLACLLRSHVQAECEFLYKVVDRELRRDEKEELAARFKKYRIQEESR